MTFGEDEVRTDVERRNELRREVGLPAVNVEEEVVRAKNVYDAGRFEKWFNEHPKT